MDDKQLQPKLSAFEKIAGFDVLLIGIGILAMEILSIISSKTSMTAQGENSVTIKLSEFLSHIRYFALAIVALFAAFLFFKIKHLGWVISFALLLVSSLLAGYLAFVSFSILGITEEFYASIFLMLVLLVSIIILLTPKTRSKFKVGKRTFLPTLVFLLALIAVFFFLQ
ncbi:MAG: hypothetical protein H7Y31_01390 [Chitinophagaceae bacterium]|nr:hypothetical protein [Chitinophagaceae bacterium]